MEPAGYLHIVKRRWWLIAALVIAAVLIVYVTTPARFVDSYEATHVLLVEGDRQTNGSSAANPEVVALWAKEDEVLDAAAAAIGTDNVSRLNRDIEVSTDSGVGTVSITGIDQDPARAALKANLVARATVEFLVERETTRRVQADEDLDTQERSLRRRIRALDAAILANPPDVETRTAERDALLRQLASVLEAQDAQVSAVRYTSIEVAERGTKQDRLPGTRSREQRMALAALVALVLGFGLAITLDRSDTRLRSRRSAEEHFGFPVVAEIVKFPFWSRGQRRVAVARQPESAVTESYRTLRSALMLVGRGDGEAKPPSGPEGAHPPSNGDRPPARGEVVMVTSAGSGDGKTTTVANLAAAYGESGLKVLVLSFDLKRIRFGRSTRHGRAPGVNDYLADPAAHPLETLVRDAKVPGVGVVGNGRAGRPPGGQLAVQRQLLDDARSLADIVLLDTSPLLASSINRELATMVDDVVVICRVGRTTVAEAERCGDLLAQLGAPTLGVVMIGVKAPEGSEYFAYWALRRERRAREVGVAPTTETTPEPTVAGTEGNDAVPVEPTENGTEGNDAVPVEPTENGHARRPAREPVDDG